MGCSELSVWKGLQSCCLLPVPDSYVSPYHPLGLRSGRLRHPVCKHSSLPHPRDTPGFTTSKLWILSGFTLPYKEWTSLSFSSSQDWLCSSKCRKVDKAQLGRTETYKLSFAFIFYGILLPTSQCSQLLDQKHLRS